ncbi:hypothetical protein KORDIASMS9_00525 [Kordia sp. SMS9]|nr:hypothetical protein KORDIASMS9_00525 [Kordia sp. SMS9]
MCNQKIVFIFATSKTKNDNIKNIMKYTIHHISALANILRSLENCSLFVWEQKGDFMYRKKWEYDKDTLL